MRVERLTAEGIDAALDDVARLRIAVFRDWPYLYDGDLDHERLYLAHYRRSPRSVIVGAFDGGRLVGAATGTPMPDHAAEFAAPFAGRPEPLETIFYCAESILLREYRGQGLGHRFFDEREAHARDTGHRHAAFCSVIRAPDHPARPASARTLDAFWRGRGYAPLPGVIARFRWKDIGAPDETEKPLQFWMRAL